MWIKAGALVTNLQPAPGVIEVYAYPVGESGRRMTHGVGTAFAEGEGEILTKTVCPLGLLKYKVIR
jgi:hypothetical protein